MSTELRGDEQNCVLFSRAARFSSRRLTVPSLSGNVSNSIDV